MTSKRKHDNTRSNSMDLSVEPRHPRPQKRRRNQDAPIDRTHTTFQLHDFKDGIKRITDWSSPTIAAKYVQIIHSIDFDNLSRAECAARHLTNDGNPCSTANIWKLYKTYAPQFYAEKGVPYIPLGQRHAVRTAAPKKTKKGGLRTMRARGKISRVDVELQYAFARLFERDASASNTATAHISPVTCRHRLPFPASSSASPLVNFLCHRDGIIHGTSGPSIPLSTLSYHSTAFRTALTSNPNILTIHHGPEVSADTIHRFNACITPTLAHTLPSHVQTPYGVFEQTWTADQLEDLYVLAVSLGAWGVCDLVLDRWCEEVRRLEPRTVVDEWGEVVGFDGLGFEPELMSFALRNDARGFEFFASLLVSMRKERWEKMKGWGLEYWSEETKKGILGIMEEGRWMDLRDASREEICVAFHHHGRDFDEHPEGPTLSKQPAKTSRRPTALTRSRSTEDSDSDSNLFPSFDLTTVYTLHIPAFPQLPRHESVNNDPIYSTAYTCKIDRLREHKSDHLLDRMQYANPRFNAHHDTAEICKEKLRMVREKMGLFGIGGENGLDEEVERILAMEDEEGQARSEEGAG